MSLQETAAVKVHGLDGSLVEPDWAPLKLDEVCSVLRHYPELGRARRLLSVSPRPFSAASVVETERASIFVKRHARAVRNAAALHDEHRFIAHLRTHDVPVPIVYATKTGETALESAEWTYEIHSIPRGIDLYGDALSWTPFQSAEHGRSAGKMLAKLHLAAADFDAPARKGTPLTAGFTLFAEQDPASALAEYVKSRPVLSAYLHERDSSAEALSLLAPFHAELLPILPNLVPIWTHNDLHPSNLLWSGTGSRAQATAVIDFGLADRTNAVHDLAHAIERSIVEWLVLVNNQDPATHRPARVPVHYDHLAAMLAGYESVRPLSEPEAAALAPMLALCHAEFALSETDYFLAVLHSPEKAPFACEGYFVAHARWFREEGSRLLDAIRLWARNRTPLTAGAPIR